MALLTLDCHSHLTPELKKQSDIPYYHEYGSLHVENVGNRVSRGRKFDLDNR